MTCRFPPDLDAAFNKAADEWTAGGKVARFWNRDATLWTDKGEEKWMGWIDIVERQLHDADRFRQIATDVRAAGYRHATLLGMGGSSLCPEVLATTFGPQPGYPALAILDSTDPAQVRAVEAQADTAHGLFIVSSKSGSTLEPNIFKQYFFEQSDRDGQRFFAVTDPGSKMQQVAESDGFARISFGDPTIGGRFSALSDFGMLPAAAMGLDVRHLLDRAAAMVAACKDPNASTNPGVSLGLILGTLAHHGRDKVTLIASPALHDLGAWLEQLIAESTGKDGKGLIPVDREPVADPAAYGDDRIFVYIRFGAAYDRAQDDAVSKLEAAGLPVVRIAVADRYNIGAEFFRWEVATAIAGAVIGINPFDQPDVEASKIETRKLTDAFEATGHLPPESPVFEADGLKFFTDADHAASLNTASGIAGFLASHLGQLGSGDYFALLAYIHMTPEHEAALQTMRLSVRARTKAATCLGFGPRFLHSTGQAYKGGPNTGVFLQVTCDDAQDVKVPGQTYTFGIVKAAQARGDFDVLSARKRRALRVHLPANVDGGLQTLAAAMTAALGLLP